MKGYWKFEKWATQFPSTPDSSSEDDIDAGEEEHGTDKHVGGKNNGYFNIENNSNGLDSFLKTSFLKNKLAALRFMKWQLR